MTLSKKRPVTLSIDREVWTELTTLLTIKGYPKGIPSWLAQQAFERTILELEHIGKSEQLDLFFPRK